MRPRRLRWLDLDNTLVLLSLACLCLLGWLNEVPIFEPIRRSRLTLFTLLALPVLFWGTVLVHRHARARLQMCFDLFPVVGLLAVYESLKHMHANRITEWLGIAPKDELMLEIDGLLFGKALPLCFDSDNEQLILVMWYFYVYGYYLGPTFMIAAAYFVEKNRPLFRRVKRGLVFGLLGGYLIYLLVPVAGPRYYIGDQFSNPIMTHPVVEKRVFDSLRYNWDCFPSLHTAISWLLAMLGWPYFGLGVRCLAIILVAGITASTILLRFHYGIDILAGILWAGVVYGLVLWTLEREKAPESEPTPSNAAGQPCPPAR